MSGSQGFRFGRNYRLVVGKGGGTGVEVSENRIRFSIIKDDTKNPNKSDIQIWGLKASTRAEMAKPGTRCLLYAGYEEEGEPQLIFEGDVTYSFTEFDRAEVITTLELGDGVIATRDSVVSLGYGPGVSSETALQDVAKQMGLTLSMPSDVPKRTWANGLTLHGAARTAMDKITRGTGLSWSIQSGVLQVIRGGGTNNQEVVELAADSGLIGTPERERRGSWQRDGTPGKPAKVGADGKPVAPPKKPKKHSATVAKNFDGWAVKSLLLPSATPGGRVKMAGREAEGVMTIKKVHHTGDTDGGDWLTQMLVSEVQEATTDRRAQRPATTTRARQTNAGGALPLPPPAPPGSQQ